MARMLSHLSPHEAYRRVDFDARVEGANPQQLVGMCYETLAGALGTALYAHEQDDNRLKSQSLTRALSAVTALQLGVSGDEGVALALRQLYQSARRSILDCALNFDTGVITAMRQDFIDISRALAAV
jgi:flagellar biosynthetic protein FliS